jgi:putative ABC transport system permease protein
MRSLRRNKLQTALTMIGMTIGVATVMTMIALGSGAQKAIEDQVRAAGMNVILVTAGNYKVKQQWQQGDEAEADEQAAAYRPDDPNNLIDPWEMGRWLTGVWDVGGGARLRPVFQSADGVITRRPPGDDAAGLGGAKTLTMVDAAEIRRLPGVKDASAGAHENVNAKVEGATWFTRLRGEESSMPVIRRAWVFPHGRFFNAWEERRGENVTVLGSVVSDRLFGNRNPIGESITLRGEKFKVIGVIASSTWMVQMEPGDGQFDAIYVPITTAQRFLQRPYLDAITITTVSTGDVTKVLLEAKRLLRQRHGIPEWMPDDFTMSSQARKALGGGGVRTDLLRALIGNVDGLEKVTLRQLGKTLDKASKTMSVLLASIASVSLIVGGIGIMNIMLLSVTERTREIGIRRAVGARSNDVMMQFLYESILLSVVGGALGILLGVASAHWISRFVQWSTSVSVGSMLVSFGVSAAVGIFFGYYPAREAAKVEPMTALRYE